MQDAMSERAWRNSPRRVAASPCFIICRDEGANPVETPKCDVDRTAEPAMLAVRKAQIAIDG